MEASIPDANGAGLIHCWRAPMPWPMRILSVVVFGLVVLSCGGAPNPAGVCNATNCLGCCNSRGLCESGNTEAACGTSANTCSTCTDSKLCLNGSCQTYVPPNDGGTGGGGAGGSGGFGGFGGGFNMGGGFGGGGGSAGFDAGSDGGVKPDGGSDAGGPGDGGLTPEQQALLTARPYDLHVPVGYDGGTLPMVLLLHGYGVTGAILNSYFGFTALSDSKHFLLATPDGTLASTGKRFWNGTDACCNFAPPAVDDVKYLTAILDDAASKFRVDPKRVFVVGHSNGGFMSHRMGCDKSERIAAIVSLAGANWKTLSKCQPTDKVAVLQVHGTLDGTIAYNGGANLGFVYPSANETVQGWATKNGCTGALQSISGTLDLDNNVLGQETSKEAFTCAAGGAAELWTLTGSGHIPGLNAAWGTAIWNFLSAHPKP